MKNNGEITLGSFPDFAYISMRFYKRLFNYLSFYRVTKNVLTLSINYEHIYAIKPLSKNNNEIQFFLFLYIHDISECCF